MTVHRIVSHLGSDRAQLITRQDRRKVHDCCFRSFLRLGCSQILGAEMALLSPDRVVETGPRMGPPERKALKPAGGAQWDTFSGPDSGRESRNCGDFQRFSGERSRVSVQPRLRGGARESGANHSLPKFPANREFNRESCKFWGPKTALLISKLYISEGNKRSGISPSREFAGMYQGIGFSYQRMSCSEAPCGRVY